MSIDPILPLSISMAEGMGTYVLFLGSGLSAEAGIPTGNAIFYDSIKLLYKLLNGVEEADEDIINEWFTDGEFKDFTYSDILEEICKTKEERRKFLEKYFIGKKPSESHYLIANMVKNGFIKVIVTTNFDRLMEDALTNKDVPFTIISSDEELESSHPREHSNCWILKLHGDYKRLNIKNTKEELENLDTKIEKEFQDILDRYGIIVMGYSGSDEGVMSVFERRDSKYMLYWLTREEPNPTVDELILQKEGKIINRKSAEDFLKELHEKIKIFQIHKTGDTPEFMLNQIVQYIKANDKISIQETLKKQWKILREYWYKNYYDNIEKYKSAREISQEEKYSVLTSIFNEFEEYCNVIIAIGLILIEFSDDSFEIVIDLFQNIYDLSTGIIDEELEKQGSSTTYSEISGIPNGAIHNMFYCLGAYALKEEKFDNIQQLFEKELILGRNNNLENSRIWSPNILYPKTFKEGSVGAFKFLLDSYDNKDFLKEIFYTKREFTMYLCQFNFILCLYASKYRLEYSDIYSYEVYPSFSRFSDLDLGNIQKLLFRMKEQYIFTETLSKKVFRENIDLFKGQYPQRCEIVNEIINAYRSTLAMSLRKLPCDLFVDNTK
jgi:NAD-dependent SIR2 family protein deacetylase